MSPPPKVQCTHSWKPDEGKPCPHHTGLQRFNSHTCHEVVAFSRKEYDEIIASGKTWKKALGESMQKKHKDHVCTCNAKKRGWK